MSEQDRNGAKTRNLGELNEHQKRHLRITCQYIDKLLSDVEVILHATTSHSPFPRYIVDLNPAQVRVIEDHLDRLRSQLVRTIAWQHMKPEAPDIPATRAVLTNLAFVDIAIEEFYKVGPLLVGKDIDKIVAAVTAANAAAQRRQDQLDTDTDHGAKKGVTYGDVFLDILIP